MSEPWCHTERIWLYEDTFKSLITTVWAPEPPGDGAPSTEYVRADMLAAAEKRIAALEGRLDWMTKERDQACLAYDDACTRHRARIAELEAEIEDMWRK